MILSELIRGASPLDLSAVALAKAGLPGPLTRDARSRLTNAGYNPSMIPPGLADAIDAFTTAMFMPWLVGILLLSGLFLTVRTGFVQVRRFAEAWSVAFVRRGSGSAGAITPFQAFMTSLAASIGTGDRKSTRLNSSHRSVSRMPSSA